MRVFTHVTGERGFEDNDHLYIFITQGPSDPSSPALVHWTPNENIYYCSKCDKEFGLFRRKHHCRRCGTIFCDECSSFRKIFDVTGPEPVRCCEACYNGEEPEQVTGYQYEKYNPNAAAPIEAELFPTKKEVDMVVVSLDEKFSGQNFQSLLPKASGLTREFIKVSNEVPRFRVSIPVEFAETKSTETEQTFNYAINSDSVALHLEITKEPSSSIEKKFRSHIKNYGEESVAHFVHESNGEKLPSLLIDEYSKETVRIWRFEIFGENDTYIIEVGAPAKFFDKNLIQRTSLDIAKSFQVWDSTTMKYPPDQQTALSGVTRNYTDEFHGYLLAIPVEFVEVSKGPTTNWAFSPLRCRLVVSVMMLPFGMNDEAVHAGISNHFRANKSYCDVEINTLQFNGLWCPGFTVHETDRRRGTLDQKEAEDDHSYILNVFGNGNMFCMTLILPYKYQQLGRELFKAISHSFAMASKRD